MHRSLPLTSALCAMALCAACGAEQPDPAVAATPAEPPDEAAVDVHMKVASAPLENISNGSAAKLTKMKLRRMRPKRLLSSRSRSHSYASRLPGRRTSYGTFRDEGVNGDVRTNVDNKSTFAADVDTGSYFFGRGYLQRGVLPPVSSVRLEEWVNAFAYSYAPPAADDDKPFAVHMAMAPSPFRPKRHLLRIGVKGKTVSKAERLPVHLVFLVDTSGSMGGNLPLVQKTLHMLTDGLRDDDTVSLVTYAGSSEELLPATSAADKKAIHDAIDRLKSRGGTDMGTGMEMAYRNAGKHLGPHRISRVMVFSDGDANIGKTSHTAIHEAVRGYVSEGITLSTVGFGRGNYNDTLMEQLANAGNGNYVYVDSEQAAKKLFVDELTSQLVVIAKDVKLQVEFSPKYVKSYRLLGYENRDVADHQFRDDKRDAGEIGAGHAVTALYEVAFRKAPSAKHARRFLTLHLRHKTPKGRTAVEHKFHLRPQQVKRRFADLDVDTRWAAAVAQSAEVLRQSDFAAGKRLSDAKSLGRTAAVGRFAEERQAYLRLLVDRSFDADLDDKKRKAVKALIATLQRIKPELAACSKNGPARKVVMRFRVLQGRATATNVVTPGLSQAQQKCLIQVVGKTTWPDHPAFEDDFDVPVVLN